MTDSETSDGAKMGRPLIGKHKLVPLMVRVSPAFARKIRQDAQNNSRSVSAQLRVMLIDAFPKWH